MPPLGCSREPTSVVLTANRSNLHFALPAYGWRKAETGAWLLSRNRA